MNFSKVALGCALVCGAVWLMSSILGKGDVGDSRLARPSRQIAQAREVPETSKLVSLKALHDPERQLVQGLSITVHDLASGLPIEGVRVDVDESNAGITDVGGSLRLSSLASEAILEFTADGYESVTLKIEADQSTVTVGMRSVSTLFGRIILPEDAEFSAEVVVVRLWGSDSDQSSTEGLDLLVSCTERGTFQFDRISSLEQIQVVAGGGGLVSELATSTGASFDTELVLPMFWAGGARINISTPASAPKYVSRRCTMPGGWGVTLPSGPELSVLSPTHPGLPLNGWVPDQPADDRLDSIQVLIRSSTNPSSLDGIRVTAEFPGFIPFKETVPIASISSGLGPYQLYLYPKSDAFSDVSLRFKEGLQAFARDGLHRAPIASVALKSEDSSDLFYYTLFPEDCLSDLVIHSVPEGTYSGWITWTDQSKIELASMDDEPVFTIRGQSSEISHIDVAHSSLKIDIRGPDDQPYTGPCSIDFGLYDDEGTRESQQVNFSSAPYIIHVARPGRYAGAVVSPWIANLEKDGEFYFELISGGATRVSAFAEK